MNVEEYEKMYLLEENYWWFKGRRAVVYMMFERYAEEAGRPLRVLDLGCGTGKCLTDLTARGHDVVGLDYSPEALAFTRRRGARSLLRGDATCLPFRDESFDAIIALDIMEHVNNDSAMASEMRRILRPSGVAIINVPAHPFLWSEHDLALHHFRRYTRKTFTQTLDGANLERIRFTYSIFSLFFPAAIYRLVSNVVHRGRKESPSSHVINSGNFLNTLFYQAIRMESAAMRLVNMPMGLSLLAVTRRG